MSVTQGVTDGSQGRVDVPTPGESSNTQRRHSGISTENIISYKRARTKPTIALATAMVSHIEAQDEHIQEDY